MLIDWLKMTGDISPRSKYIDSCIRKRLNPRASLILRKNFTKRLNLQHHGIGDEMAILFAEAIINIPYIEAINIGTQIICFVFYRACCISSAEECRTVVSAR